MKKRFLIILVVMFSWCNVGFADVLKFNCKGLGKNKNEIVDWVYSLDTGTKTLGMEWKMKGSKKIWSETFDIVKIDQTAIEYKSDLHPETIYRFNYGGDLIDKIIAGEYQNMEIAKCTGPEILDSATGINTVEIASMIDDAKDTCKSLGFNEGTEKFSDCALKLYSQSVELAAKQNQQIVMQPQSSGSNVMTIYDPVRDSNALMDKGMKMLTGRCTLGLNC